MAWYVMVGVKKDSTGISTVHPWKAQDGPFCPFQPGHPDQWQPALKPKLNSKKCLGKDSNSGRISYWGSLPTSLRNCTCLHSLSHFSLRGLQTTTFPKGLKYIYIFFILNFNCLNIGPLSKSNVFRYRIFILCYSLLLSRYVILKIRLITAGGEFGSFLLFGKKEEKNKGKLALLLYLRF